MSSSFRIGWSFLIGLSCQIAFCNQQSCFAAGGILNLSLSDEKTSQPVISRVELLRTQSQRAGRPPKLMSVRKTIDAGIGMVVDRSVEFDLPDGAYQFRIIRGPEYRIITGNFSLEKTSLDDHHVDLPRMVDMLAEGWMSGDCLTPRSTMSLPLRMASEDLHVAAVHGEIEARPIAGRDDDDPILHNPTWIRSDVTCEDGLVFYGATDENTTKPDDSTSNELPTDRLIRLGLDADIKIAIENPFAWQIPVWLATDQIDGVFVLGDWLRLDRDVKKVVDGRRVKSLIRGDRLAVGRWGEKVYHQMLESGLQIPPLAGGGDDTGDTPVGYNRVYVTSTGESYRDEDVDSPTVPESMEAWWHGAMQGHSIVTNGPCLRPSLGGKIPGHTFTARTGEALLLRPELRLAVRDPVDYLDVIHNGTVHYSAKLDEFAKAGGEIPPIEFKESGWVIIRVVTQHEDHFRAAISAPWYIVFDGKPRVTTAGVQFFVDWLKDYEAKLKTLPPNELKRHIKPIQRARRFWSEKLTEAADSKPKN